MTTTPEPPTPGATAFSQRLLSAALLATVVVLLWKLSDLLVVAFGGVVLAVALDALAGLLATRLRVPRRGSLLAALALLALLLAGVAWLAGGPLIEQLLKLRDRLPAALETMTGWLHAHPLGRLGLQAWQEATADGVPWSRLAGIAGLTFGMLGNAALLVIMGIFLAGAPGTYRGGLVRLMPVPYRARVDEALVESGQALRRWLLGQAVSMAFVGGTLALGLWLLGIALPLAVGLIAGLLGFIPFFGAMAGGLLAVLLAFMDGPTAALHVALLCVAIQQVEGHVLMPLVQKWAVHLPPVLAIAAAVVFGALFGIIGVLFATPMMVVFVTLVRRLYVEGFLERGRARTWSTGASRATDAEPAEAREVDTDR
jgi:predicted PurR-regulated permease PerM